MTRTSHKLIPPGSRVRVVQRVVQRAESWTTTVEGEVVSHQLEPTGAWYAYGRDDHLWLPRLRIRKADGEVTVLNLDADSQVTVLE